MDRVSYERLDELIAWLSEPVEEGIDIRAALTELRERREYEKDKGLVEDWRNLSKSYENIP